MHYLRENGKSVKTDDNSLKFILIDRNSRKSTTSSAFKELDTDIDRLQKLRKRMFWSRNNNNTLDTTRQLSSTIGTPSSIGTASGALNTLSRPFAKLKHKSHLFGVKLEKLCGQTNQLPTPLLVN